MYELLLELAWFLPWCWVVNMSFSVFGYVTRANPSFVQADRPLDGMVVFLDGKRIFGDSTTWGGLALALLLGLLGELSMPGHHLFMLAVLVFTGHAFGSFIKRRLSIGRGTYLPLIDHVDYLILLALVSVVSGFPTLHALLVAYFVTLLVTPVVTFVGFRLGIRSQKL
jgi:CDP-2,3-bis-(O-geranylgeranyl)-sn-glycerol synthase